MQSIKRLCLLLIFTLFATGTMMAGQVLAADWYDPDWNYRKMITIDSTKVPNTDQSNFSVLINTTDADWRDTTNGGKVGQSDGGDILFTDSDGTTKLSHEIEKYSPSTGELIAWVEVPAVSASSDTDIYIYYGNTSGGLAEWNINGTWDSNYVGVWHLKEEQAGTGTLDLYQDSTINNNDGDDYVSATGQNGQINSGQEFDGVNDYVNFGNDASLDITNGITIEAWVKPELSNFDRARYVIDSVHTGSDIDVVSYVDNNVISVSGSPYITLNAGQTGTISSSVISQGTEIDGTGPFALASESAAGDEMVPATFKGTEFVYDAGRGSQYLYFCNPFGPGNANITVYNSAGGTLWGPIILAQGNCASTGALNPVDDYYRVLSDIPILGQADNGGYDGYVMYPISDDLWGISSNWAFMAVGKDSTTVDIYCSGGASSTGNTRNEGYTESIDTTTCTSGSDGSGDAIHIDTSQSAVGAIQQADSDGVESTTFLPNSELSYVFAVPQPSEYIALALNEGSKCIVYDSSGNILDQQTTTQQTYPYPSKIHFAGIDYVQKFPAGVFVVCDAPAYAYYERIGISDTDEINIWGLRDLGIVSKGGAYALTYSPGGKVNGFVNGIGISADASLSVWNHLVFTYNGSEQKIYVDGVLKATRNLSGLILNVTTNLEIGRFANWYFNSSIDEVRISSTARSADWIKTSYNNQDSPSTFYTVGSEEALPDLIVSYLSIPKAKKNRRGHIAKIFVDYRVMNQGDGDSAASELGFYLSRDTVLDGSDTYVGTVNIPSLAPGEETPRLLRAKRFKLRPPVSSSGTWYVLGKADDNDDNTELDENNNVTPTLATGSGR